MDSSLKFVTAEGEILTMAKFLTTTGVSDRLEKIIKGAEDRLVLISPFLRVNPRMKDLLEDRDRLKIDVRMVYGKSDLHPEENNWLESLAFVRTSYCKNLHAKCYLNEKEALLTSMNLYDYSQVHNEEMGLLVSREEEPELYDEINEDSKRILRMSEEIRVTVARVESTEDGEERPRARKTQRKPQPAPTKPTKGFCIRCGDAIPADPTQPYCARCYRSWNRYKNEAYEEKRCHTCGDKHGATLLKPLCLACYKKYQDVFEFAVS